MSGLTRRLLAVPGAPPWACGCINSHYLVWLALTQAQQLPSLRERNVGCLHGLTYEEAQAQQPAAWAALRDSNPGERVPGAWGGSCCRGRLPGRRSVQGARAGGCCWGRLPGSCWQGARAGQPPCARPCQSVALHGKCRQQQRNPPPLPCGSL
jgi:hypothetical protein